ncbi:MAG: carboxypeptidase regulatory-like domain-containing protein [Patescibacteria group bacterium]
MYTYSASLMRHIFLFFFLFSSVSAQTPSTQDPSTFTVPMAPSGLVAKLAASGVDVDLMWTDNAANESAYNIYRQSSMGGNLIATIEADSLDYKDRALAPGTYYYYVSACNTYGCSPASNPASASVMGSVSGTNTTPPPPPTSTDTVAPVPPALSVAVLSSSELRLYWSGAADNSGIVRGYKVFSNGNLITFTETTMHTDSGLVANTSYNYYVKSVDMAGNESFPSNMVTATTFPSSILPPPPPPTTEPPPPPPPTTILPPPPPPPVLLNATVRGKVLDDKGKSVSGAGIHVFKKDFSASFGAMSASDGTFNIDIPPGTYEVEVFAPFEREDFLRPQPVTFDVSAGTTKEIVLQAASVVKIISGTVQFVNGNPVSDAEVGAYSKKTSEWTSTFTDGNGSFTMNVSGGEWIVGVRPRDPSQARWTFSGSFPEIEFRDDAADETKTVGFTITVADAILSVTALHDTGTALPNVGVVVDTLGTTESLSSKEARVPQEFKTTDANGKALFYMRPGEYHVRVYLPDDRGLIVPEEQDITLSAGGTNNLTFTFRKKDTAKIVLFTGMTKRENGSPISAFVWAWSEKGNFLSAHSDTKGAFSFEVSPHDRWHVGAGILEEHIPITSSEVIMEIKNKPVSIELILVKQSEEPLPVPVTSSQSATEHVVVQSQDGAKVSIPPQAAASSGTVSVEVRPTVEAPSQAGAAVVSTVYDITVRDQTGKEIETFKEEVEVILPYDEAELAAEGVSEDAIIPSFFDEKTGVWVKIDNYTIDKEKNVVIARVKHLTRFALVAAADITPPEPPKAMKGVAQGSGKIKLSWQNPAKDFSHAKIYRSEKKGELGKIIAAEAKGAEFIDQENLADGIFYYYLIRAVDPAGNETNNLDQIMIAAAGTSAQKIAGGLTLKTKIVRNLFVGSKGDDVSSLQELLRQDGVYPEGLVTGFFGNFTKAAVIRFQEKYAKEILAPVGLSKGTGLVGSSTRKKIDQMIR